MEDYISVTHPTNPLIIFGLFDGHGGSEVSRFVSENLSDCVTRQSFFPNRLKVFWGEEGEGGREEGKKFPFYLIFILLILVIYFFIYF